jgi:hypothetical protein
MEDTITTTYCLCEEFLKAIGHHDDPQTLLSTAEVMTVALVACASFGSNIERSRLFLHEHGYMPKMLSKSRLNRRLHAIPISHWEAPSLESWPPSSRSESAVGSMWWTPYPSQCATTSLDPALSAL